MNSMIICEGPADYFLLQYYMRKAYCWNDEKECQAGILKMPGQKSRNLIRNSDILTIMAAGGCSRLSNGLQMVLDRNFYSRPDLSDVYCRIAIITDRDEAGTEQDFIHEIQEILNKYNVSRESCLSNNAWIRCSMSNQMGLTAVFYVLLMVIPFEENGAMETFLLNAVKNEDTYDKEIIEKCSCFVEQIDPERKYLTTRRYVTKAKFDTYFSIRTPVEQYAERQKILKNLKWEQYTGIQNAFQKLGEL